MKAILLSRPGDFGLLEELWEDHPLFLPVLGQPLVHHHAGFLKTQGIREVRLLWALATSAQCTEMEERLQKNWGDLDWSVRSWNNAPFPEGQTLPQVLNLQRFFLDEQETLVLSAPNLFLEPLTGPRIFPGFPESTSLVLAPKILKQNGSLENIELGKYAPLSSPRDFFQTQMKLVNTMVPRSASLKGVHPKAELIPPLFFQDGIRISAGARIGPQCLLAPGTRVGAQAKLERIVVLSSVEIGKGFELQDQIIHGNKILSPYHNSIMEIPVPRLLRPLAYRPR